MNSDVMKSWLTSNRILAAVGLITLLIVLITGVYQAGQFNEHVANIEKSELRVEGQVDQLYKEVYAIRDDVHVISNDVDNLTESVDMIEINVMKVSEKLFTIEGYLSAQPNGYTWISR